MEAVPGNGARGGHSIEFPLWKTPQSVRTSSLTRGIPEPAMHRVCEDTHDVDGVGTVRAGRMGASDQLGDSQGDRLEGAETLRQRRKPPRSTFPHTPCRKGS